ncbi:potassium transporter Kup [Thorsellia anophelis]|uniref:Low affinity potassium transport system protein Kup n=1 Tax=Thorsellia anophelis DSM 18579 TaxID=1123402 RepID=A0A1I0ABY4_9GAMM|nr:KUP/HAK/KT family potassium transporter [Thorsellia anophelis]SES91544.1 KUP system potassium uptake protein [Thorsellia anophelis DSM 18579]
MAHNILPVSHATYTNKTIGTTKPNSSDKKHSFLFIAALGVVFGDIGTSPLYTFNVLLGMTEGLNTSTNTILGLVSLILWTLILITSVKYVSIVLKINNHGEGGLLALMSLIIKTGYKKSWIIFAGLIGAGLLYGDGALTPAVSILSALEGLQVAFNFDHKIIVPIAITILVVLFSIQPFGTAKVGRVFGPIMVVWFTILAIIGIVNIIHYPTILRATNPYYAFYFLSNHIGISFAILGAAFLCVTGAEALYADMGHFGIKPIRQAWYFLAFPSLLLNYAGQGAFVLQSGITQNIFFNMVPEYLVIPLVILATTATVIASQALITGAFSLSRQAIQLGWLPNMRIIHTSESGSGQIYIGAINLLLFSLSILLILHFKSSANLAAAYGISVSIMMLITTCLLAIAMRKIWSLSYLLIGLIIGIFLIIDGMFVIAGLAKFFHGGYLPILLSLCFFLIMSIWRKGFTSLNKLIFKKKIEFDYYFSDIKNKAIPRVEGVSVFITHAQESVPPILSWHVERNKSLTKSIISITIISDNIPWITDETRTSIIQRSEGFYHINAHFGFMEKIDIPLLLSNLNIMNFNQYKDSATYYVSSESIVVRQKNKIMPKWQTLVFAWLVRNSIKTSDSLHLPNEQVVEIGRRIAL